MSVAALNWAQRQQIAGPASLKSTLVALGWAAGKEGACYPSQATLASKTGLSERSVRAALITLERLGLLTRQRRSKGRFGRASDLVTLALHREFAVSKQDIDRTKSAGASTSASGEICRLERNLQPAKNVVPTGKGCRGYYSDTTVPIQEGSNSSSVSGYGTTATHSDRASPPYPTWDEDYPFGVGRA